MKITFEENHLLPKELVKVMTHPDEKKMWNDISGALENLGETITAIDAINNRHVPVLINQLVLVESEGRMCNIKTESGKMFLLNMRLKIFEERVKRENFIKINNQVVINIHKVESFRASENARLEVVMKDKSVYFVNRYYVKLFKEKFAI